MSLFKLNLKHYRKYICTEHATNSTVFILLQCEVSGYNINDYHMSWVRQAPGAETIEWLAAYRPDTTHISESFKDRVTPSTSGSTAQLRINKLSSSDTATFYCTRHIEEVLCRQCVKSAEKGLQNSVNYPGTILSRKTTHIHKLASDGSIPRVTRKGKKTCLDLFSLSVVQSVQSEPVVIKPGGSHKLSCTASSLTLSYNDTIWEKTKNYDWYR
ncbi:hypothetical protein XELAEV_18007161mg [Xenopus laevis]|uniref:Ig-like domain-containing protein n=1 Tax=Xenopus laevis TaxID=8355 RepID=A0A974I531_XENLA|nr:hypothetical protein XELAEV_18007161mg [Xenopus laevis]